MTADLKNSRQIKKAIAKLYAGIHRAWQRDLDCRFPLTYWLAVNTSGLIIACNAVNQVSQDNFKFTPLSELMDSETAESTPTAKLQVVFNAPAFVDIKPLSGIPLPILTIIMLSAIFLGFLVLYPFLLSGLFVLQ